MAQTTHPNSQYVNQPQAPAQLDSQTASHVHVAHVASHHNIAGRQTTTPSRAPYPSNSSDRQTSHTGYANPMWPQESHASAHPQATNHYSAHNAPSGVAPVPEPSSSHHPQNPPPVPSNPTQAPRIPTPPPTAPLSSASCRGASDTIYPTSQQVHAHVAQLSNNTARTVLEPMRQAMCQALTNVHISFTTEYARMHGILLKAEHQVRDAHGQCATLEREYAALERECVVLKQDCARLRIERDTAIRQGETFKQQQEKALYEMQTMAANVPTLVFEHLKLKTEHAAALQEIGVLKEANATLREKASADTVREGRTTVGGLPTPVASSTDLRDIAMKDKVKEEAPRSPIIIKEESRMATAPDSPSAFDSECALELAQTHGARKRKLREGDAKSEQCSTVQCSRTPPTSTSYAPLTPASPLARHKVSLPVPNTTPTPTPALPATSTGLQNPTFKPAGSCPSFAPVGPASMMKIEESSSANAMPSFAIPELGNVDVSGELEIIDLTQLDSDDVVSPMRLTYSFPPFTRRAAGPKTEQQILPENSIATPAPGSVSTPTESVVQERPTKRQRTVDMDVPPANPKASVIEPLSSTSDSQHVPDPLPRRNDTLEPVELRQTMSPSVEPGEIKCFDGVQLDAMVDKLEAALLEDESPASGEAPPEKITAALPLQCTGHPHPQSLLQAQPQPSRPNPGRPVLSVSTSSTRPRSSAPTSAAASPPLVTRKSSLPATLATVGDPAGAPRKLQKAHIPLIYDITGGQLICNACMARYNKYKTPQTVLDAAGSWEEATGHYERQHPAACEKLVAMTPAQLRFRLAEKARDVEAARKRKVPG
ncbi:hypothetical protein C8Q80DRAFT_1269005 [Daedaleopsis nitida]|nr:hypothetical protein C8Q80DRAFT_1269005 [Daedaleopsis nitida]